MDTNETSYRTETICFGNVTINVHRPILTEAEKEKTEESIKTALADFSKKD